MRQFVGNLTGVAARACAVAAAACVIAWAPFAQAQSPARPFSRDIYYTVTGGPGERPKVRMVRISGPDVPGASVAEQRTISLLPEPAPGLDPRGVGDLMFGPDGELLVAGAANKLYKVRTEDGSAVAVQAALSAGGYADAPKVLSLVCDPAADKAWALGEGGKVGIVGLMPALTPNEPLTVTGSDLRLHSMVWTTGSRGSSGAIGSGPRVLYTAIEGDGGGEEKHHLGRIDFPTLQTTRLVSNLPPARVITMDAYTGSLVAFGGTFIAHINPEPLTPIVTSQLDLATIPGGEGINLVDGTVDGEGRLFAVSSDGRLIVADYAHSRSIASNSTRIQIFRLEASPAIPDGAGSIAGLAPLTGPGRAQLAYCVWDNGEFDGIDGQVSRTDSYAGAPMTADDFYLEPDSVFRIDTITASLSTNSILPKARLSLYDDCDGSPGTLLASYESLRLDDTGARSGDLRVYRAEFPLGGVFVATGRTGRTFWISVQGVGLGLPEEEWYWATAGQRVVRGSSGRFRSSALGYPQWTPVDDFGCGCSDFAFAVIGERCKTLHDGGSLDLTADPAGSLSQYAGVADSARSADDFVTPPRVPVEEIIAVRETICYLRAFIYSNCTPVRGQFELYENGCKLPVEPASPTSPPIPIFTAAFSRVTDLGYTAVIDGHFVQAYCVESVNLDWSLPAGRDYWLAAVGETTFGLNKRSYFAYGRKCDAPVGLAGQNCLVTHNPAAAVGQGLSLDAWTSLRPNGQARDLAFLVATRRPYPAASLGTGGAGGNPSCPADLDRSGSVTLQDLLEFLSNWFQGCP